MSCRNEGKMGAEQSPINKPPPCLGDLPASQTCHVLFPVNGQKGESLTECPTPPSPPSTTAQCPEKNFGHVFGSIYRC